MLLKSHVGPPNIGAIPHLAWQASCSNRESLYSGDSEGKGTQRCRSCQMELHLARVGATKRARVVGRILILQPSFFNTSPALDIHLLLQRKLRLSVPVELELDELRLPFLLPLSSPLPPELLTQHMMDEGPGQRPATRRPLQNEEKMQVPFFLLHAVLKTPPGTGQHLKAAGPPHDPVTVVLEQRYFFVSMQVPLRLMHLVHSALFPPDDNCLESEPRQHLKEDGPGQSLSILEPEQSEVDLQTPPLAEQGPATTPAELGQHLIEVGPGQRSLTVLLEQR